MGMIVDILIEFFNITDAPGLPGPAESLPPGAGGPDPKPDFGDLFDFLEIPLLIATPPSGPAGETLEQGMENVDDYTERQDEEAWKKPRDAKGEIMGPDGTPMEPDPDNPGKYRPKK